MSDPQSAPARNQDGGFTLIELLISIVLTGVLTAALSATTLVIVRQQATIAGRFNDARSENGVGFWIPADLSSADQPVDNSPTNTPCFTSCPSGTTIVGSNAFLLSWSSLVPNGAGTAAVTKLTRVSYRYALVGKEYQLIRVQCDLLEGVQTCKSNAVAHNLAGPPDGSTFVAGTAVPDTVIKVTAPLDPSGTGTAASTTKNAQRVLVSISGGGTGTRASGGSDTITLGASGTDLATIAASNTQTAPNLVSVRSKCGGLITLVVDESASISTTDFAKVKTAIADFVTMFAGTPVRLSIVPFDTYASALGTSSSNWTPSYNMLDQTQVDTLLSLVNSTLQSYVGQPFPRGGTNWEDGLYHVFYKADGTVAADLPDTLVFFTDGVPTFDRLAYKSSTASATPPAKQPGYADSTGYQYSQQSFNRANLIASQFRGTTQFIGVGVGSSINDLQTWIDSYPGYHYDYSHSYHYTYTHQYHYVYTHSYHYTYSHGYHYTYSHSYHYTYTHKYKFNTLNRFYHVERAFKISGSSINRFYHIEKLTSGVWATDSTATASTALDSTHRVRFTAPFSFAKSVTTTANATADMATNWSTLASPTTTNLTLWQAQSDQGSPSTTTTDGWSETRSTSTSGTYWEDYTAATTATTLGTGVRVNFSAPYLLSASVTPSSNPTTDGSTSWSTVTTGTTNTALFDAEDNGGAATDSTDGWTTPAKTYISTGNYADTNTDGSGYISSDPSWSVSAKQYSAPFTGVDTDTVGAGYSSTDPAWAISAKQYSAPYTAYDTNTDGSGGYSTTDPTWSVSAKQYSAPFTASDPPDTVGSGYSSSDASWARVKDYTSPFTGSDSDTVGTGYSATDAAWTRSAKQYSSPYVAADVTTDGTGYSSTDPSWSQSAKQYTAPYTAYDTGTPVTYQVSSDKILARLISDSDTGVPATVSGGSYTNAAVANMYILPQWDQFAGALKAIGLASCGGSLTLQTKVGTAPAADPFKYSKYSVVNSAGATLPPDNLSVTTSSANPSGTFDLNITDGTYVTVEIEPADISNYTGYTAGAWSCKALGVSRSITTVPITGSVFTGFRVRVAANEAVSCTQAMTR